MGLVELNDSQPVKTNTNGYRLIELEEGVLILTEDPASAKALHASLLFESERRARFPESSPQSKKVV